MNKRILSTSKLLKYLLALLFLVIGTLQSHAQAGKATTGTGLYKDRIFWLNWDLNSNGSGGDAIVNGTTRSFTSPSGVIYTATVSGVSGSPQSSSSYSWSGNNFPYGYGNIGGDNGAGNIIGINNGTDGRTASLKLTIVANYPGGGTGNVVAFVIAGTESLNGNGEYYQITTPTGVVKYMDKYIYNDNWGNTKTQLQVSNNGKIVKVTNSVSGDSKGDALLVAENVPSIDVEVKGGGGQHFAIGFIENVDYSDAPDTYGKAVHIVTSSITGGTLATGANKNLSSSTNVADMDKGTFADPLILLGTIVDTDTGYSPVTPGFNPDGDDRTDRDDEDAIVGAISWSDCEATIKVKNLTGNLAYLSLWIDANRNGIFETNEKASRTVVTGTNGEVKLPLSAIVGLKSGSDYYTRIRFSTVNNLLPTGYASDGEVEDHWVNINATVVTSTPTPLIICQGQTASFVGASGVGNSWSWKGPNNFSSTSQSPLITNAQPSHNGIYTLTVTYNTGCIISTDVTLTVTPTVAIAAFSPTTSVRCQGAGTVTTTTTATNSTGITYSLDATTAAFAGNSIDATTGAVTYSAGWSGTTTITASAAGCNGPKTTTHVVTVTPTVAIAAFSPTTSVRCQGAGTVTTTTTATNSTGITYSLDATTAAFAGNSIDATTGAVTYSAGWSGTTTITASAAGCNGPKTTTHVVTVTPTVAIAAFSPTTSVRCQGAGTVTITTTATNSTAITYSLDATTAAFAGNSIDATTGAVTYSAGWSGTTTITASAAGCNGPKTTTHVVTVTPTVAIAAFSPTTSVRCQGAGTVTTTTTATNSTGITYSLDATTAAFAGNSIEATTGAVTYSAGWSGTTTITASAAGCNGPKTTTHVVTVTPTVAIAAFSPTTSVRCQGAGTVTTTTTATNSTGITYSLDATTAAFAGNSIDATTGAVTYSAGWSGTTTITASAAGCNGPKTTTHVVMINAFAGVANNTTTTTAICETATKTLSATPAGGTWSVITGGGNIAAGVYTPADVTADTAVTIQYTVAANGSCAATTSDVTFTVNAFAGVANNTTTTTAICETATKTLSATPAGGTWSIITGGGNIAAGVYTPADVTADTAVTIQYTVAANGSCVATTSDVTFTVNAFAGVANNTTTTTAICETATKTLSATPAGGTWSIITGGGNIAAGVYTPADVTADTAVTIQYTVAANGSCAATTSDVTFTVNAFAGVANNTTTTTAICETATKTLSATPAGGTWSVITGGGNIAAGVYTPADVTADTAVTIQYTVAANGSCAATTSDVTFTVNAFAGVANNTTTTTAICETATKTLSATPAGGTWSIITGGGNIAAGVYTPADVTADTAVTIQYTVAANGSCAATTSDVTFTVNAFAGVANNTTTTTAICETATKTLSATPAGGTWSIITGGGNIAAGVYTPADVTADTAVTIQYTVAANGSCVATTSDVTFTVNAFAGVANNTTTTTAICETATKTLSATPAGGTWSIITGGGNIAAGVYTPADVTADTAVTIQYTVAANGSCAATTSDVTFTVNAFAGVANNTTTTTAICETATKTLSATPAGGTWSVITGGGNIAAGVYTPADVTADTAVTIQYTVAANGSCAATTSDVTFTVNAFAGVANNTTTTTAICETATKTLSATPAGGTWSVITGGGNIAAGVYTPADVTADTAVTIQYTVAANGSCAATTSDVTFTVNAFAGVANNTTTTTAICETATKTLSATPAGGTWSIITGGGNIAAGVYTPADVTADTAVTIQYTVAANGSCAATTSDVTFTVNAFAGVANNTTTTTAICETATKTLSATPAGGTWSIITGGGNIAAGVYTPADVTADTAVTIQYTVAANGSCVATTSDVTFTVNAFAGVANNTTTTTAICETATKTLSATPAGGTWSIITGGGNIAAGVYTPADVTADTAVTIQYTVAANGSCAATTSDVTFTVNAFAGVANNTTTTTAICETATKTLSATPAGGTWSIITGGGNIAAGVYTPADVTADTAVTIQYTVAANGSCAATTSDVTFTVNAFAGVANNTTTTTAICETATKTLSATPAGGTWSIITGGGNIAAGVYTPADVTADTAVTIQYTVAANGSCAATTSDVTFTVNAFAGVANNTTTTTAICETATKTLSATPAGGTWSIITGGGNIAAGVYTPADVTADTAVTIQYTVAANGSCVATTSDVTFTVNAFAGVANNTTTTTAICETATKTLSATPAGGTWSIITGGGNIAAGVYTPADVTADTAVTIQYTVAANGSCAATTSDVTFTVNAFAGVANNTTTTTAICETATKTLSATPAGGTWSIITGGGNIAAGVYTPADVTADTAVTIQYTVAANGSCAATTSDVTFTVNAFAGVANNTTTTTAICETATKTLSATPAGGTWSVITGGGNIAAGVYTPADVTADTAVTIQYTVAANGSCAATTSDVTFTVNAFAGVANNTTTTTAICETATKTLSATPAGGTWSVITGGGNIAAGVYTPADVTADTAVTIQYTVAANGSCAATTSDVTFTVNAFAGVANNTTTTTAICETATKTLSATPAGGTWSIITGGGNIAAGVYTPADVTADTAVTIQYTVAANGSCAATTSDVTFTVNAFAGVANNTTTTTAICETATKTLSATPAGGTWSIITGGGNIAAGVYTPADVTADTAVTIQYTVAANGSCAATTSDVTFTVNAFAGVANNTTTTTAICETATKTLSATPAGGTWSVITGGGNIAAGVYTPADVTADTAVTIQYTVAANGSCAATTSDVTFTVNAFAGVANNTTTTTAICETATKTLSATPAGGTWSVITGGGNIAAGVYTPADVTADTAVTIQYTVAANGSCAATTSDVTFTVNAFAGVANNTTTTTAICETATKTLSATPAGGTWSIITGGGNIAAGVYTPADVTADTAVTIQYTVAANGSCAATTSDVTFTVNAFAGVANNTTTTTAICETATKTLSATPAGGTWSIITGGGNIAAGVYTPADVTADTAVTIQYTVAANGSCVATTSDVTFTVNAFAGVANNTTTTTAICETATKTLSATPAGGTWSIITGGGNIAAGVYTPADVTADTAVTIQYTVAANGSCAATTSDVTFTVNAFAGVANNTTTTTAICETATKTLSATPAGGTWSVITGGGNIAAGVYTPADVTADTAVTIQYTVAANGSCAATTSDVTFTVNAFAGVANNTTTTTAICETATKTLSATPAGGTWSVITGGGNIAAGVYTPADVTADTAVTIQYTVAANGSCAATTSDVTFTVNAFAGVANNTTTTTAICETATKTLSATPAGGTWSIITGGGNIAAGVYTPADVTADTAVTIQYTVAANGSCAATTSDVTFTVNAFAGVANNTTTTTAICETATKTLSATPAGGTWSIITGGGNIAAGVYTPADVTADTAVTIQYTVAANGSCVATTSDVTFTVNAFAGVANNTTTTTAICETATKTLSATPAGGTWSIITGGGNIAAGVYTPADVTADTAVTIQYTVAANGSCAATTSDVTFTVNAFAGVANNTTTTTAICETATKTLSATPAGGTWSIITGGGNIAAGVYTPADVTADTAVTIQYTVAANGSCAATTSDVTFTVNAFAGVANNTTTTTAICETATKTLSATPAGGTWSVITGGGNIAAGVYTPADVTADTAVTIQYTVAANGSCAATTSDVTFTVNAFAGVANNTTTTTAICETATKTLSATPAGGTWSVITGGGNIAAGVYTPADVTADTAVTIQYTVAANGSCAATTSDVTFTVNAFAGVANNTTTTTAICETATKTLSATPAGGTWSIITGGGNIAAGVYTPADVTADTAVTIQYTVAANGSCAATTSDVTFTVNAFAGVANNTTTTTAICETATKTLSATPAGGTWSIITGGGNIAAGVYTPADVTADTAVTIQYTVAANGSCAATTSDVTFTVNAFAGVANNTTTTTAICETATKTLSATPAGGTWSIITGGGNIAAGVYTPADVTADTAVTIQYTVAANGSCAATTSDVTFTVNAFAGVANNTTTTTAICETATKTLSATPAGGTWSIITGGGNIAAGVYTPADVTADTAVTIQYTVAANGSCAATTSDVTFTVNAFAGVANNTTTTTAICETATKTLSATPAGGTWSVITGGGNIAAGVYTPADVTADTAVTIQYTVAANGSCAATTSDVTFTVNAFAGVANNTTTTTAICETATKTLSATPAGGTWSVITGGGNIAAGVYTPADVTADTAVTIQYTVAANGSCAATTSDVTFTVNAFAGVANNTTTTTAICETATKTLSATPAGGTWSVITGGGNIAAGVYTPADVTADTAVTIQYTVAANGSCAATTSDVTFTVNAFAGVANNTTTTTAICETATKTLSATPAGGTWSVITGGGNIAAGVYTPADVTADTAVTIQYTVAANGSCAATTSDVTFTVNAFAGVANNTTTTTAICETATKTLSATPAGGTWSIITGGGNIAAGVYTPADVTADTAVTIQYTVAANGSCAATTSDVTFTVNAFAGVANNTTTTTAICETATKTLSATPAGGTWSIITGGGNIAAGVYTPADVTADTAVTIQYTVAANGSCVATTSDVTFTVNAFAGVANNTTTTTAICETATKTLSATPAGGTWSIITGGGNIAAGVYTPADVTADTAVTIQYTVAANGSCAATTSDVTFTVNAFAGVANNTTTTTAICETATKTLSATPAGGTWSIITGGGNIAAGVYTPADVTADTAVTIQYTVAANGSCAATTSDVTFTVNAFAGVANNTTTTTAICETATKTLSATPAGGTWSVITGGGNIAAGVYTPADVTADTAVTIQYTVAANGSCAATTSDVTFTVNAFAGVANNTTTTTAICETATKTLSATPAGGTWSVITGGGNIAAGVYTPADVTADTAVTIQYTVAANGSCAATTSDVTFTVNAFAGVANNTTTTTAICETATKTLSATPAGGTWSIITGGGNIAAGVYTPADVTADTAVTIQYTVAANGSCAATTSDVTFTVNAFAGVANNTTTTTAICETATKTLSATPAGGTWSIITGGGNIAAGVYTPADVTADTAVTIQYTVAANGSCVATTSDVTFTVNAFAGVANNTTTTTAICETATKTLSATPAGGTWSIITGGGNIAAGVYTPADVTADTAVTIQYTVAANGSCAATTSDVTFTVNAFAGVANNTTTTTAICETATKTLSATPAGGTWSIITGGGNIAAGVYTPADVTADTAVTIQYTVAANGSCAATTSDVTFTVNAFAGVANNTTTTTAICETATKTLSATPAGGTWSVITGGGNIAAGVYTPADVTADTAVTIQYTVAANGSCAATTSDVTFTVNAFAGVANNTTTTTAICETATKTLSATPAGGTWSVITGGGNIAAGVYTPADVTADTAVTIQYTVAANGSCAATTSDVTFTVNAFAGVANNTTTTTAICETATKTLSATPAGGTWSVITGGGNIAAGVYTPADVTADTAVTIQYTVAANGSCAATTSDVTFTVNAFAGVANNTTTTTAICETATKTLSATPAGGTWSIITGGGNIAAGVYTPADVTADTAVTIQYTVAANGSCAATTSDVTFTVNAFAGVANNTTTTTAICETATKTLSATPAGGTWSVITGGGNIAAGVYTPADVTADTAVTIQYTVAANGSCAATTSDVTFTVNAFAGVANNTTTTTAICETATKTLSATPAGGTWSVITGGGNIAAGVYTPADVTADTAVTIQYTVAANGSCAATTSDVTFTVNAFAGVANNTTTTTAICETATKTLSATPAGGTWSIITGGGNIAAGVYTPADVTADTAVTIQYTVAANGSCAATTSDVTFTVNAFAGVANNTTTTTAICETATKTLSATPAGGTWSIITGGGNIAAGVYTPADVTADTAVTIQYTVAANGSCAATTSDVTFTVNAFAGVANNTTTTTAICETATKTLSATPAGGTWSVITGGGNIAAGVYTPADVTADTAVTIQYTVAANGSCAATTSDVTFTVNATQVAPIVASLAQPICSIPTGSVVLSGLPSGNWIINPGNITGNTPSKTITGLLPGTTYNFTVTTATGCTSASVVVTISNVLCAVAETTPSINGNTGGKTQSLLSNDTLNGNSVVIGTNSGQVKLTGITVPTGLTLNTDGTITVAPNTPEGNHSVTYRICEVSNPSNCSEVTSIIVVGKSSLNLVEDDFAMVAINGITGGTTETVLGNDTLNGIPVKSSDVDLQVLGVTAKGFTLNANGTITVAPKTKGGKYTLIYQICERLNGSNCSTAKVTVFVETPSIAIIKTAVANDENGNGNANAGETISYKFKVSNTGNVPLYNVTITDPLTGIVMSGSPINLNVYEFDEVSFTAEYVITQGDINNGSVSNQATAYGTTQSGITVSDKSDDLSNTGDNPTVLALEGCKITIFNAVSPNGDRKNERFYIQGLECYPNNTVEIFNRWGVLVFEREHYNNEDRAFRGMSEGRATVKSGDKLPVGTYYYVVKYKDSASQPHQEAGYLYIN